LRDYRFYDIDLAHPNYAATQFVLEHFTKHCIAPEGYNLMEQLKKIHIASNHKPFNSKSNLHQQFLQQQYTKVLELQQQYPFLSLQKELNYFANGEII
jgi:hypothetical protein